MKFGKYTLAILLFLILFAILILPAIAFTSTGVFRVISPQRFHLILVSILTAIAGAILGIKHIAEEAQKSLLARNRNEALCWLFLGPFISLIFFPGIAIVAAALLHSLNLAFSILHQPHHFKEAADYCLLYWHGSAFLAALLFGVGSTGWRMLKLHRRNNN